MPRFLYHSVHAAMRSLHSMIDTQVTLAGEENIDPDSPMFFCANHFTRFETFVMPNVFYQKLKMDVRSLADSSLFVGKFAELLENLGTVSTKDPKRNEKIISDLMVGRYNWIIYPEGMMMKNKKVTKGENNFILHTYRGQEHVHTGAVVLALKSELDKRRFSEAQKACNLEEVEYLRHTYELDSSEKLAYRSTKIIPVTITYTPIYPGENWLQGVADSLVNDVSDKILEELEIEGNILFDGSTHIHLGEPIDIAYHIEEAKKHLKANNEALTDDAIINHCKDELTLLMMDRIYSNVRVNFDHLFAILLAHWEDKKSLDINELKTRLFMMALALYELRTIKMHDEIKKDFFRILANEPHERFDKAFDLALRQGVLLRIDDKHVTVDKEVFCNEHDFLDIRIKNTFLVIYHEVAMLDEVIECMKKVIETPRATLQQEACMKIHDIDVEIFNRDYKKFYSLLYAKPKEVGEPFLLYKSEYPHGVVLSHGYKSAPKEVRDLADFIHALGFNVYGVRLLGHGTMPEDLRDRTWQDWYDSYNMGYAALSQVSEKIYLAGFSTGGLLTLLSASRKKRHIAGIISINAALRLNDIQFNYVLPTVSVLNNFLAIFNADIDYVEGTPENPDINYAKHYLSSVGELKKLMEETDAILQRINTPILIIQGDHDPVVKAISADLIHEKVASETKEKVMIQSSHHVIITREEKKEVFEAVKAFLDK